MNTGVRIRGFNAPMPHMLLRASVALLFLVPLAGAAGVPPAAPHQELVPGPGGLARGAQLSNGNILTVIGGGTPGLLGDIGFDTRGNFVVNPTALGDHFSPFSFAVVNPNSRDPVTGNAALLTDHNVTAGGLSDPGAISKDQANGLAGQPLSVRDAAGKEVFRGTVVREPAAPPGGPPSGGSPPPPGGSPPGGGAPPAGGGPPGGGLPGGGAPGGGGLPPGNAAPAGGRGDGGDRGGIVPCGGPGQEQCTIGQISQLGRNVFNFLMGIAAIAAVAAIVVAGFRYVGSRGDPSVLADAKQRLTNAIIGFLILLFTVVIVNTILAALGFEE